MLNQASTLMKIIIKPAILLTALLFSLTAPSIPQAKYATIEFIRGAKVDANILKITTTHVIYKRPYEPRIYKVPRELIYLIRYSDGGVKFISPHVMANVKSGRFHRLKCNHLPPAEFSKKFESAEAAMAAGYIPCPACFPHQLLDISDYELEKMLGYEVAARVRYWFPLSPNDSLQAWVRRVGEKVVDNWPEPLIGYRYDFKVIEGDVPQAIGCPGGKIFVSTALLDLVESDEELEAVIAHEVTHVEKRHGLKMFKKAQKTGLIASVVGGALAVATAAATKPPIYSQNVILDLTVGTSQIAALIVLSGYSKGNEIEADYGSFKYLSTNKENIEALKTVLKKLKFFRLVQGPVIGQTKLFYTHPSLDQRIEKVEEYEKQLQK